MRGEPHLGENLRVEAQPPAIEKTDLSANHPAFLQPLDTPPAGRLRKADSLGDFTDRAARIGLELCQDPPVRDIDFRHIFFFHAHFPFDFMPTIVKQRIFCNFFPRFQA